VQNCRDGLVEGLESVLAGDMPACDFSVEDYRRAAIEQFVGVAIDGAAPSPPPPNSSKESLRG
jgi:hypothetical protein